MRRLSQGAWGDSICIAAICNLFDVTIEAMCANTVGTAIVANDPISGVSEHVLTIGLTSTLKKFQKIFRKCRDD